MDRLEAEFLEPYDKVQEYLDSRKGELSSLAIDASENTRQRRIEERVVRKSVEIKLWRRSKLSKNKISLVKEKI